MQPVRLVESERSKPIGYDPKAHAWLYIDDIKAGRAFSPKQLSADQQRALVLTRYEQEDDVAIESVVLIDKREQIEHIRSGTDIGHQLIDQDVTFLDELIQKIQAGVIC